MSDFRLLAWLRWRQWRSSALYWLRVLGYEPGRTGWIDKLYVVYLILFGLAWVTAVGLAATSQAAALGRSLPATAPAALFQALPVVVTAALAWLSARTVRTSPLLLSYPDMAYVAASPLSRTAVVLVNFTQAAIQALAIVLVLLALVVVVIAQPLGEAVAHYAALRAGLVAVPVVLLLLAVAWTLGLLRLAHRDRPLARRYWLAALLLAPLGFVPPFRWFGDALAAAIRGSSPLALAAGLTLVATLAIVLLARAARRTDLTAVAEESQTYARLNALGLMAFLAPDLTARIRRQEALARRRVQFALPHAGKHTTFIARSWLLGVRRPLPFLGLLLWGFGVAAGGGTLILSHAPVTLWFFWVSFIALRPPTLLVENFQADMQEPYLRQLLPANNLLLALSGGLAPALLALGGGWLGWAMVSVLPGLMAGAAAPGASALTALPRGGVLLGAVIVTLGVLIVFLAQAAAYVRLEPLGWQFPYLGWLLICVVIVGFLMLALSPLTGVLVGGGIALFVLVATLLSSPRVAR